MWEPGEAASWEASEVTSTGRPVLVKLADVQREEVDWLWTDRLPLGKLTIIMGDPEVGKGWLSLAIATAVTTGAALPGDSERHTPANVLILTAEDGLGDTVRPRAEDMGADLARTIVLSGVSDDQGNERHLSLVDDLSTVEKALEGGGYRYFIIDPLNAYLGAALDTNRDAAMRSVLTPLAALAERYHVAIACILHLTKSGRDRAIYRGQGSIAYMAAARVVLLVGKNPDNEQERVVACVKNNLAPHPPSLAFEISDGRFLWRGESPVTAVALLAPEKSDEERSALQEAKDFLRDLLVDGPKASDEVKHEAKSAGISSSTLKRAKVALGVQSERSQDGFGGAKGHWEWVLPPQGGQDTQCGGLVPLCETEPEPAIQQVRDGPLVGSCQHRPPGEAGTLWAMEAATWGDDAIVCWCCGAMARGELVADADGLCPTCRSGRPAPAKGEHLLRMALDASGTTRVGSGATQEV